MHKPDTSGTLSSMKRAVVLLVVLLAACSSSAKSATPNLRAAVEGYVSAFGKGDGDAAWSMVSTRCRGEIDQTDYKATVAAAGVKYKGLRLVTYRDAIDGSAATVTYKTSSSDLSYKAQRWVLERGAWRWDGC